MTSWKEEKEIKPQLQTLRASANTPFQRGSRALRKNRLCAHANQKFYSHTVSVTSNTCLLPVCSVSTYQPQHAFILGVLKVGEVSIPLRHSTQGS